MFGLGQPLRWLKEAMRNKAREELCAALCAFGVVARIAERGRPEEETTPWWGHSLGVIDVGQGPIGWINITYDYSPEGGSFYLTDYGVPVPRYPPELKIKLVGVRTFPIFGEFEDVRWLGDDHGLGIGRRLSNDPTIRSAIRGIGDHISVVGSSNHRYWLIRHETFFSSNIPSVLQWRCYQAMAEHLLEVRVPGQQTPS